MITEKLDGTNAAIGITDDGRVYAQSRNRIILPSGDNYGFAAWVEQNQKILSLLGPGLHFGEWWGVSVGRGYGLSERRFSLFNVIRWGQKDDGRAIVYEIQKSLPNFGVVPLLYEGPWMAVDEDAGLTEIAFAPSKTIDALRHLGSIAVPGYMNPEGIVVYHKASQGLFKATLERDHEHKNLQSEGMGKVAA